MATTETPERRHWLGKLVERWPTVLGLATVAALGAGVAGDADNELGDILLMLPLLYLIVAKLRRPASTWPVVIGLLVLATVVSKFDIVRTGYVFAAIALILLVWAAVDGQLGRGEDFTIQALGMAGFGALAVVSIVADPEIGRYVLAACWLLHGVWDFVHLRLNRTVARSFAEWCAVVDVLVAVALVVGI
ncbi:hypothetical protein [Nocardia sp. NPDC058705]|uniref:hypothetical protein n=1 Tax=Nocardia sp. NPDC058705 TaxID=3346609 RepID=UPI0036914409